MLYRAVTSTIKVIGYSCILILLLVLASSFAWQSIKYPVSIINTIKALIASPAQRDLLIIDESNRYNNVDILIALYAVANNMSSPMANSKINRVLITNEVASRLGPDTFQKAVQRIRNSGKMVKYMINQKICGVIPNYKNITNHNFCCLLNAINVDGIYTLQRPGSTIITRNNTIDDYKITSGINLMMLRHGITFADFPSTTLALRGKSILSSKNLNTYDKAINTALQSFESRLYKQFISRYFPKISSAKIVNEITVNNSRVIYDNNLANALTSRQKISNKIERNSNYSNGTNVPKNSIHIIPIGSNTHSYRDIISKINRALKHKPKAIIFHTVLDRSEPTLTSNDEIALIALMRNLHENHISTTAFVDGVCGSMCLHIISLTQNVTASPIALIRNFDFHKNSITVLGSKRAIRDLVQYKGFILFKNAKAFKPHIIKNLFAALNTKFPFTLNEYKYMLDMRIMRSKKSQLIHNLILNKNIVADTAIQAIKSKPIFSSQSAIEIGIANKIGSLSDTAIRIAELNSVKTIALQGSQIYFTTTIDFFK